MSLLLNSRSEPIAFITVRATAAVSVISVTHLNGGGPCEVIVPFSISKCQLQRPNLLLAIDSTGVLYAYRYNSTTHTLSEPLLVALVTRPRQPLFFGEISLDESHGAASRYLIQFQPLTEDEGAPTLIISSLNLSMDGTVAETNVYQLDVEPNLKTSYFTKHYIAKLCQVSNYEFIALLGDLFFNNSTTETRSFKETDEFICFNLTGEEKTILYGITLFPATASALSQFVTGPLGRPYDFDPRKYISFMPVR